MPEMANLTRVTVITLLACLAGANSLGRTRAAPVQSDTDPAAGKPATGRHYVSVSGDWDTR